MAVSETVPCIDAPQTFDLDRCVHCGLCLNACPTYRELGVEMDSPRGRVYQMVQVASGAASIDESYIEHIDLCLACRGCESACPSGVQYGRLVEAARADIEAHRERPWAERTLRGIVFERLLPSPAAIRFAGRLLWAYQRSGLQSVVRATGILKLFNLEEAERLAPAVETPFFYEPVRPDLSGGRREEVSRRAARRVHRQCVLRTAERGNAARPAKERLRGHDSLGPDLLRRAARARRASRGRTQTSAAEYRCAVGGRL